MKKIFPDVNRLWRGSILASIVHGVMVSKYPDLSHEQSWDGNNYSVQDSCGARGTIAFSGKDLVGVFFDKNSVRNPFKKTSAYDMDVFFRGMPKSLQSLAHQEALPYVLQDYQGKATPLITAAFWNKGEALSASEPWSEVVAHGAHLVQRQCLETEAALNEWRMAYEMSSFHVNLAKTLFNRKMATPNSPIAVVLDDQKKLAEQASTDGLQASRTSLGELNIHLP